MPLLIQNEVPALFIFSFLFFDYYIPRHQLKSVLLNVNYLYYNFDSNKKIIECPEYIIEDLYEISLLYHNNKFVYEKKRGVNEDAFAHAAGSPIKVIDAYARNKETEEKIEKTI